MPFLCFQDFIATSPQQVYTIVDYIVAKKIRFRINEFGTNAEFCWQLQLVGCRADEGKNAVCIHYS